MFPENIYAATGDDALAFGLNGVYDPASGAYLQAMPAGYEMMAIGDGDRYLYSFDTTTQELHVMSIVPEPASLALLLLGLAMTRCRRQGEKGLLGSLE